MAPGTMHAVNGPSRKITPPAEQESVPPKSKLGLDGSPENRRGATGGFPRTVRLLKHADFQRVYKTGRREFLPHMTVFWLGREEGGPRIGLGVGRALGGAVERNRIKRRMREAVRHNLARLTAPVDVVINPKKSAQTAEFKQLQDEVGRALETVQKRAGRK